MGDVYLTIVLIQVWCIDLRKSTGKQNAWNTLFVSHGRCWSQFQQTPGWRGRCHLAMVGSETTRRAHNRDLVVGYQKTQPCETMTNGFKLPVSLSFSAGTFGSVVADVTLPQANVASIVYQGLYCARISFLEIILYYPRPELISHLLLCEVLKILGTPRNETHISFGIITTNIEMKVHGAIWDYLLIVVLNCLMSVIHELMIK